MVLFTDVKGAKLFIDMQCRSIQSSAGASFHNHEAVPLWRSFTVVISSDKHKMSPDSLVDSIPSYIARINVLHVKVVSEPSVLLHGETTSRLHCLRSTEWGWSHHTIALRHLCRSTGADLNDHMCPFLQWKMRPYWRVEKWALATVKFPRRCQFTLSMECRIIHVDIIPVPAPEFVGHAHWIWSQAGANDVLNWHRCSLELHFCQVPFFSLLGPLFGSVLGTSLDFSSCGVASVARSFRVD